MSEDRVQPALNEIALMDLFAPSARLTGAGRVTTILAIPSPLASMVEQRSGQHAWLSDTVYFCAWLLCQWAWRGVKEVVILEPHSGSASESAWRESSYRITQGTSVSQWVGQIDAVRRTVATTGTDSLGTVSNPDASIWCVADTLALGKLDLATPIALGSRSLPTSEILLNYPTAAMDAHQAQSVLAALLKVAEHMVQKPDLAVDQVALQPMPPTEELSAYDPQATVHGAFAEQARSRGDAIALMHKGLRLSYRELEQRAQQTAQLLQNQGVNAGDIIAVSMERSIDAIVGILAILKVGAAYLPLDSNYPAERLAFILRDATVSLLMTTRSLQAKFAPMVATFLIDAPPVNGNSVKVQTKGTTNGKSLAYVMYTSGSTGVPKGVEICHESILRLVRGAKYVSLNANQSVLHAAPLGFDASTLEIWGPLLNGGLCVLHDEDLPTASGLARTIRGESVSTAWLTAALFNAVVDDNPSHLEGLTQLLIGGEALSVPHVRKALRALPSMKLINGYGPTECTTFTATYPIPADLEQEVTSIPIGRPITDTQVYVLSPRLQALPDGLVGELYVGGRGLARGYLNRPELTAERFILNPFTSDGDRLYRTGDLVRYRPDGNIEFVGRADGQVKVRGFRIEVGEVEAALMTNLAIKTCAVVASKDTAGNTRLVAYLVARNARPSTMDLRGHLSALLPEFMLPAHYVWMVALPITPNGKLDRKALPEPTPDRPEMSEPYQAPGNDAERRICAAFSKVLGFEKIGRNDNFFDLGGNSLLVLKVLSQLEREGKSGLSTSTFFSQPTPAALARALESTDTNVPVDEKRLAHRAHTLRDTNQEPIAVIAMAGRFPGAASVEQFWDNLCAGKDSITFFKESELDASLPTSLTGDPCYVKARGVIENVEMFDAAFFGISSREAELMDPQQRIFMELCWQCLERGGYAPDATSGPVGVFAGMYNASYFQRHIMHRPDLIEKLGEFQVMLANEKDYIATRIANRLNLTGPAVSVHTACSTSLVAIAQAFGSLRAGQCDMALAGGASITCPPRSGYLFQDGAMLSPDGLTRSFDAQAQGTVFSDGAAVVLLKRLSDALADGDTIHAVIRGVAVNNDGRDKASFTAPSVDGQAAVIAAAHEAANVDPRSLTYVEAHGTATPLGDPVELEALTRAFRRHTPEVGFCRIGSVKSNVGHMVIAAGAAGVIKTALSLAAQKIPASLHFDKPNPQIDFANSPFVVNDTLTDWPRTEQPRRAGVSSFGVGGTNAHVVLEEAPVAHPSSGARGQQLLLLSAKTRSALDAMALQLAAYLKATPDVNLADVAHTLQVGRSRFPHRMCVSADTPARAALALSSPDDSQRALRMLGSSVPEQVWLFPGQGAQYAGMGSGLYSDDPVFRTAFDDCLEVMHSALPFDLKARMFQGGADALVETGTTQPATFCLEYALAQSWLARGAKPSALIGHSVGEFVAAVLSGVMTLADAARLVAKRGALMQALPSGSMLSVRLPAQQLAALLPSTLSLAADNGPTACVVAGPTQAIQSWRSEMEAQGIVTRVLQTSHAFHSTMMDAVVLPFEAEVRKVTLAAPRIPIVSTLTGTWLSPGEATDPSYWARHLREPVRFSPALRTVLATHNAAFLEIGPRGSLSTLARQHANVGQAAPVAIASLGDSPEVETVGITLAHGQLWTLGIELPVSAASPAKERKRICLPSYPFEGKRFWIDADTAPARSATTPTSTYTTPSALPSPSLATKPMSNTTTAISRRPELVARLRELFEDVAGTDLGQADPTVSFVELGLDSLTLTQAALQVKKQFNVSITFRQLMEKYRSLSSLAEFLDNTLPAVAASTPTGNAPQTGTLQAGVVHPALTAPAFSGGEGLVQQVIAQQMQIMAQQLALLQGGPNVAPAPSPSPAALPAAAGATAAPEESGPMRYDVKKAFGAIARIHTQPSELTERQRARLDAFMRRYVERTKKSKAYTVHHRAHLADPRVVNGFRPMTKEITYQITIERSKGSQLWDLDGNVYVDVLNGFGMNLFGWQPDFINEAVHRQVDAGYEIGPQHPLAGEVADLICELTGFDRAALCNTGSEAVMAAVRIARTVTGRNTVVVFAGSYHGTFDEVLVRAGRGGKGIPAAPGIMSGVFGDVRVLEYGTAESLEFIRQNADDLAAVLVETVQSRRPDFQPVEFLKELRKITQDSDSCLIFDEVITGFRSHLGGIQALFGIRADLACYGKVIGGGFPIGVVAGKRDFMDALDGGAWQYGDDSIPTVGVTYFAGTFVRHPLALAASKASLLHLKQQGPQLQAKLSEKTAAMAQELTAFCKEMGAPLEIRHFSSLWRVSWLEDHPLQDLLYAMMRSRGIHILDNFPCFLTTAHTDADVQKIISAFKESVKELQESDFLPKHKSAGATVLDASKPPVPGARLGKDADGKPAWFIPDPNKADKYLKVNV